jgi:hypothetical protein
MQYLLRIPVANRLALLKLAIQSVELFWPHAVIIDNSEAGLALLRRQRHCPNLSWHDDCDPGGRVVRLQLHAARGDGGDSEGVGPKSAPQSVSQKFPRAEEGP